MLLSAPRWRTFCGIGKYQFWELSRSGLEPRRTHYDREKAVPRQAILYLSHLVNRTQRRSYDHLKRECAAFADVYFLLNLNNDIAPPNAKGTFPITPAHREALGHPSRAGTQGWWMETSPSHIRDIQSGFDQALLAFRQLKPEYDYYWIVEYDVEFSGRWSELFNAFANNKSDLLCSSLHRFETNPTWAWWKSLVWPHQSQPELI